MMRMPTMTLRGPYRWTRGPTIKRMSVEHHETMFELPVVIVQRARYVNEKSYGHVELISEEH